MSTQLLSPARGVFLRTGLSAALYLGLSVPAVLSGAFALSGLIPMGHAAEELLPLVLMTVLVFCCGLAGALWGRSLARQTGVAHARRLAWASGLIFGPLTLAAILTLSRVEVIFVEQRLARGTPIHVIFAVAFTAAAFAVTAGLALGVGWAARGWRFGLRLALWAGLAAAAAFLLADIAQDLLGRRVGAPGAERTATMLTVALLGNVVAAFVGGGVIGQQLAAVRASAQTAVAQTVEANA